MTSFLRMRKIDLSSMPTKKYGGKKKSSNVKKGIVPKRYYEIQFTQSNKLIITPELNQLGWTNCEAIGALNLLLEALTEIKRIRIEYYGASHELVSEITDYVIQVKDLLLERVKGWVV